MTGRELKSVRHKHRLTQKQLAKVLGLHPCDISVMERAEKAVEKRFPAYFDKYRQIFGIGENDAERKHYRNSERLAEKE